MNLASLPLKWPIGIFAARGVVRTEGAARLLKTHAFLVAGFALGKELLGACATRLPACLVLDLHLPGINGFKVLEHFAARRVPITAIVVTGRDAPGRGERVRALGAVDYLLKPLNGL